ncbi:MULTISPECIES: peptidylprolyl isomerase PpiC [Tatumella]|uniref:peptidylprolyl isomerase n=1 Tax=Tatumella punctata TaxID=399969 RepID=A0ABW1VV52_9GAMM|nr:MULTISPECIES: peptidylprolyl isomerase PpiC [unclassified Tatumella]MBS0857588.1 peptidylprolyl isomerase [Tatumella sp. JGM16]MBS0878879.1 peptidylprolyl isomerase [Tatumella sp. JGM82]MBS0892349.1 peptidylprolyl isomerase [Tatumella sp. JGM94]MBS0895356.1 peptidylprolyl isomerase [Tatumella sp. JGM130]MBS0903438.1 peptidylprolyl isomerase [Tatumella sp. JGM100]
MAKTAAALHILVKEESLAKELLLRLQKGASFQQLAKKHSACPSGRKGGELGEFRRGQMVPAFDKAVFSCPLLVPYGPVKTSFGYHIIKVLWRN